MSDIAIRVENLSKQYHIDKLQKSRNLRETLVNVAAAQVRRARKFLRGQALWATMSDERIWALKDVSFEIKYGDVVGVIGRNGAGKSTLLKILSRITEPTAGRAELYGTVGSLLEVGTGFHHELTGRENIYLSGAILGMRKAEIERKFDEIVEFSGVMKFIDTPIKRYSSGMYVRLGFAVAAHLDPEILLIDEVLAVGDAQFQKKCINKMKDVAKQGRTVIFISHDMSAITRLCERTILLNEGKVLRNGPSRLVVSDYLNCEFSMTGARKWSDPEKAPGNEIVRMLGVRVKGEDGQVKDSVDIRQPVGVEIEFEVLKPGHVLQAAFNFFNEGDVRIFASIDHDPAWQRKPRPMGRFLSTGWIPGNFLAEGTISASVAIITEAPYVIHCEVPRAVVFYVIDSMDGDTARGDFGGVYPGVVRPLLKWTTQYLEDGCLATTSAIRGGKR